MGSGRLDYRSGGRRRKRLGHIERGPLNALLVRKRLPLELILEMAAQLAEALEAAHAAAVVHRDLKPANVFVSGGVALRVKLLVRETALEASTGIDLSLGKDSPHKWVVIYGDNGLGKSTLLRALGLALTGQPALN